MQFIANENISATLISELRDRDFDVLSVRELIPGASDQEVLAKACAESRIVLTHDKDFGELAFRYGLPASCGVILLRLSGESPEQDASVALNAINSQDDWDGHFSVITEQQVRMRPLPTPPSQ